MSSFDFEFTEVAVGRAEPPNGKSGAPTVTAHPIHGASAGSADGYTPLSQLITAPYENGLILIRPATPDLTELILPPEIVAIGYRAFYRNDALRRFRAEKTLKIIQDEAFRECLSLRDVAYDPDTAVFSYAFRSCPITDATVTSLVYKGAFRAGNVRRVSFRREVLELPDELLCYTKVEEIALPSTVSLVGDHVFAFCKELKKITFPDAVSFMGCNVFESCSQLEEFTMPKGVGGVPAGTFAFCGGLKRVSITDRPGEIGKMAFYGCDSLRELRIPYGIHKIGEKAVMSSSLERVIFEGRTLREVRDIFGFAWLLTNGRRIDIVCTDRTYTYGGN